MANDESATASFPAHSASVEDYNWNLSYNGIVNAAAKHAYLP